MFSFVSTFNRSQYFLENYGVLQTDPHTGVSKLMILYVHTEACEVHACVCTDSVSAS